MPGPTCPPYLMTGVSRGGVPKSGGWAQGGSADVLIGSEVRRVAPASRRFTQTLVRRAVLVRPSYPQCMLDEGMFEDAVEMLA